MTEERPPSPIDAALDVLVYVPVGLALTLTEELPKLAAKGRSRVGGQVSMARMIGQLAAGQGRKLVGEGFAGPGRATATPGAAPTGPAPARGRRTPRPASAFGGPDTPVPDPSAPARPAPAPAPSATGTAARRPGGTGPGSVPSAEVSRPAPRSLAIPNYDSLSASQVVQRLAGLSGAELEAVRRYEAAGRGRRTILSRVGQLQSS